MKYTFGILSFETVPPYATLSGKIISTPRGVSRAGIWRLSVIYLPSVSMVIEGNQLQQFCELWAVSPCSEIRVMRNHTDVFVFILGDGIWCKKRLSRNET